MLGRSPYTSIKSNSESFFEFKVLIFFLHLITLKQNEKITCKEAINLLLNLVKRQILLEKGKGREERICLVLTNMIQALEISNGFLEYASSPEVLELLLDLLYRGDSFLEASSSSLVFTLLAKILLGSDQPSTVLEGILQVTNPLAFLKCIRHYRLK